MGLAWNPSAIPGLLALATGVSMAVLVYWTRPDRSQNRRLALLLSLEGSTLGALGLLYIATSRDTAAGLVGVMLVTVLALPWAYLAFLATLDSPLVKWLDNRVATVALALGAALAVGSYFLRRELFVERFVTIDAWGVYDWVAGPLGRLAFAALLAASLFGLVVAVSFYRQTAKASARRPTARAYVAAFGVRDTLQGASILYILTLGLSGASRGLVDVAIGTWIPQVATVLFTVLLAYGIFKTQLFDIDLKVKIGIRRSTLVGVFAVVFLFVSEAIEALLGVEGALYGLGAAVAIGLFFRRIETGAQYVADRLMPGVKDTPSYREERKQDIYRAQLEELLADEAITGKERRALRRLQASLGLTDTVVGRLEREVTGDTKTPAV